MPRYVFGFTFAALSSLIVLVSISCTTGKVSNRTGYGSPTLEQELVNDHLFKVTKYAEDNTYGYSPENPVMVGGPEDGPKNERRFLHALAGPNGETLDYFRLGSCCPFPTEKGFMGGGLLDMYEINYEGCEEPVVLFINMYDSDKLRAPVGFTLKYE